MNPVVAITKQTQKLEDVAIGKELVDWLEKTIPERCPGRNDCERDIWIYAGKRALVRSLAAAFARQQERGAVVQ